LALRRAIEPRTACERSRREDVAGARALLQRLQQNRRPPVIEPLIPVADREMLVGVHVVLARLALGGDLPVGLIVERARVDQRLEQDRLAVRPPPRLGGPGGTG